MEPESLRDAKPLVFPLPFPDDGVILCGAGVSAAAPTNLPTVSAFLNELETQCIQEAGLSVEDVAAALHGNATNAPPRFEQIISILAEFDPELACLDYLRVDHADGTLQPNILHLFLAHHIYRGGIVVTTNFDALIEIAYSQRYGTDVAAAAGRLLKIHGSVQTTDNGALTTIDMRHIKADIASVAAGNPISGEAGALIGLSHAVSGREILVLGYSFSDSFDVVPALINATPSKATIVEYAPGAPRKERSLSGLPNFLEIGRAWKSKGTQMEFFRGDFAMLLRSRDDGKESTCIRPERVMGAKGRMLPYYGAEKTRYAIARLLQGQDDFVKANSIFRSLVQRALDPEIKALATFFYVRTLADWDEMLPYEGAFKNPDTSLDIRLRGAILFLNVRSFIGPKSSFLPRFSAFKAMLNSEELLEGARVVALAKAHHCFANYLMNCGRPNLALRFAEASLAGRTRFGEPIDIFNAEYACCLALTLSGNLAGVPTRLKSLARYSRRIGDQNSAISLAIVCGLYHIKKGRFKKGIVRLTHAKSLYAGLSGGTQVDPELELYILEAKLQTEGWGAETHDLLAAISVYVYKHNYMYYMPIIEAFEAKRAGNPLSPPLGRLTLAHLRSAGLM